MSEATLEQHTEPEALTWADSARGWLHGHERAVLFGTVVFQVAVLLGMIGMKAATLIAGETILLRVRPVDPRDLFRGDYVILSYDFSRPSNIVGLSSRAFGGESAGRIVYVPLTKEPGSSNHWHAGQVTTTRPAGGVFLQGRLTGGWTVECGIESYFVQEGKGRMYEDAIRAGRLYAEIAVNSDGQAVLKGLKIE